MNIQPISTNYNTNFQAKLKGKYAIDMLDYAIQNPRGSRRIVDGVRNILENGKNEIIELNYSGNKLVDFIFKGAYQVTKTVKTQVGEITEKKPWDYNFIGGGIGVQSKLALEAINEGKVINENNMLEGLRDRLTQKQKEIFDEYDYNGGREKVLKKLHQHYDYLEKKYCALIREEAIKLKKIITQENNK